jgi:hypothetical protein
MSEGPRNQHVADGIGVCGDNFNKMVEDYSPFFVICGEKFSG